MKRYLLVALVGLLSMSAAFASDIYEMPDYYGLNTPQVKRVSFAAEFGIARQFDMGLRMQRNFNEHFSWDILTFKYGLDYSHKDKSQLNHEVSLTTGLRATSSRLGSSNIKVFGALDLGWKMGVSDCEWKDSDYWYDDDDPRHTFVPDITLGVQFGKSFYVGYGICPSIGSDGYNMHTDHTIRFGVHF